MKSVELVIPRLRVQTRPAGRVAFAAGCRATSGPGTWRPAYAGACAIASARRTIARVIPLKMNRWNGASAAQ